MNIDIVYHYTILILGLGLTIKSLEFISTIDEFGKGKPFDWNILGRDYLIYNRFSKIFETLYSKRGTLILTLLSLVSYFTILFLKPDVFAYKFFIVLLITVNVVLYFRHGYGLDGADQMTLLILLTIFLCTIIVNDYGIKEIGVWFIAMQLSISYIVAGVAKLISSQWRSGLALQGILSTYTYGTSLTKKFFINHKTLSMFFCWSVIIFEIAYPFVLFFYADIYFISIGILFHLSIAVIMGLNDFVWGFAAAYPSFYYVSKFSGFTS